MTEERSGRQSPSTEQRLATQPVVYFHIGAPKTGTTFLQRILWNNRERLADHGMLYPGTTFSAHVHAAFDLRKAGFRGYRDPQVPGAWAALVDAAKAWDGPVILSQELFSPATKAQIDRALDDLSFAEIHLIYTARELTRQVPAAWQEDLKNRFTIGLDEYVAALRDPAQDALGLGRMFWRMQDAVEVLRRWARNVPANRVHIVTVPQRGGEPDLLWRRFAQVVQVDADQADISDAFQNSSLGPAEAAFLRRLNETLDAEVGWPLYNEMVKHHLAQDVLVRRDTPVRLQLPAPDREWFATRGSELVGRLRSSGYDVVGSLDDLEPPLDALPTQSGDPTVEQQLDIAIEAMAALLLGISRRRRKAATR